jgi:hypothetical protein
MSIPVYYRNGINAFQGFFCGNRHIVDQAKSHCTIKLSVVARRAHKGKTMLTINGSLHSSNSCAGSVKGNGKRTAGDIGIRIQPVKLPGCGTPLLKPKEITGVMNTLNIFA